MIKTAKLRPGRGFRPVNAALYYGMRLVPYAGLRRPIAAMLARYIAARERIRSREGSVGAPAGRSDPVLASLRENGCAWLPPLLSQSQIDDVLTFLEGKKIIGCVPPFTHSALKRAIRLMIPAVRRQLHMDPHGSNMHLSKQNQQVSDICSQS